ncbi:multidrug effflux MFS transporter [Spongiibacter thalassae]|nr:multidrug effflux MFS transporter [Spongiibacter thalassae]
MTDRPGMGTDSHGMTLLSPLKARTLPLLLAGLAMLGPFTINMYMPSFAAMRTELGVDDVQLQITLSLYFTAFAFMSLWHGTLSDRFGRRWPIVAGLFTFSVASFGIALSRDIHVIYLLRVLQGLSAGAGIVIGRAVIRDVYEGPAAQRAYATVVMVFSLAPAVGPVIGGWLHSAFGWRASFGFLGGISTVLLLLVLWVLPETLARSARRSLSFRPLLRTYKEVFLHFRFMSWAVSFALMFGGFFVYVLSAPVFLLEHLHLGPTEFLWLFGPATAGMMLGSFLSGRLAPRWPLRSLMRTGFAIMAVATVYNLVVSWLEPQYFYLYLPFLFVYTLGMSLVQPSITLLGLDCLPDRRGTASSIQLFTQTSFNAMLASVVAPFVWGAPLHLAVASALMLTLSLSGIFLLRWLTLSGRISAAPIIN